MNRSEHFGSGAKPYDGVRDNRIFGDRWLGRLRCDSTRKRCVCRYSSYGLDFDLCRAKRRCRDIKAKFSDDISVFVAKVVDIWSGSASSVLKVSGSMRQMPAIVINAGLRGLNRLLTIKCLSGNFDTKRRPVY